MMTEEVEEDDTAEEEGAGEMSSADKLLFVVCQGFTMLSKSSTDKHERRQR